MQTQNKIYPTTSDYSNFTLNKWSVVFNGLYQPYDNDIRFTTLWLAVAENAADIAENIREDQFEKLTRDIIDGFVWILSFLKKCCYNGEGELELEERLFKYKENPADLLTFKYPGICGTCFKRSCACSMLAAKETRKKDKLSKYRELLNRRDIFKEAKHCTYTQFSLEEWVTMFEDIYGDSIIATPIEHLAFHYAEEVGEVANVIRRLSELHEISISELKGGLPPDVEVSSLRDCLNVYENNRPIATQQKEPGTKRYTAKEREAIITFQVAALKLNLGIELGDAFSWLIGLFIKVRRLYAENSLIAKRIRPGEINWEYRHGLPDSIAEKIFKESSEKFKLEELLYRLFFKDGKLVCHRCEKNPCICYIGHGLYEKLAKRNIKI